MVLLLQLLRRPNIITNDIITTNIINYIITIPKYHYHCHNYLNSYFILYKLISFKLL